MFFWEDANFIKRLESIRLVVKNKARGLRFGENRSKYYGHGIEVSHLKNYSEGEDIKFIDWNSSFRLNKVFLKVFSETRENNVYIMVDSSASMNFGAPETKSQLAIKLAYSLTHIALSGFNKVVLIDFAERIKRSAEVGKASINRKFAEFLTGGAAVRETGIARSLNDLFASHKRRGILFVISDFMDGGLSILDAIARLGLSHNFCLIQVLCADDLAVPGTGEYKFEDCESGEFVDVSMTPEMAAVYASEMAAFCAEIEKKSFKYGGFYKKIVCGDDPVDAVKNIILRSGFTA